MRLLVIRFSAMGDVALTRPVIKSIINQFPDLQISFLTNKNFVPLFSDIPKVEVIGADLKGKHAGLSGLYSLFRQIIKHHKPDHVIDLHSVLRSWFLCFLFKTAGIDNHRIDKGRKEKKKLTARNNKILSPLKHSTTRYFEVFEKTFLSIKKDIELPSFLFDPNIPNTISVKMRGLVEWPKSGIWIGIAPFSKHSTKEWPLDKFKVLIDSLTNRNIKVLLFGGGPDEIKKLEAISRRSPLISNLAGCLSLTEETRIIKMLDIMISMDSFNMHLATLVGTPVISLWGPTHPHLGFGPLGKENQENIIMIDTDQLTCRPCSVFGQKPCWRGDHACMQQINEEMVLDKVNAILARV